MDKRPIGVFDSGVGGLTVVKAIKKQLPEEAIVYFGDTARVPYGSKSKETVTKFSAQIIRFLLQQNVKAIIIACNTVSSNSIEELRKMFPQIHIEGVVEAGVHMALQTTTSGRVGVIGTEATIESGKYPQLLKHSNPNVQVWGKACPLFVPLVEDGWATHPVAIQVATEYLTPMLNEGVDTIILGCTHYPMLIKTIGDVVGDEVRLVNPAKEAARRMGIILRCNSMEAPKNTEGAYQFYVSDHPQRMQKMAQVFLDYPVDKVGKIDIETY
jgi:glutamate racemase